MFSGMANDRALLVIALAGLGLTVKQTLSEWAHSDKVMLVLWAAAVAVAVWPLITRFWPLKRHVEPSISFENVEPCVLHASDQRKTYYRVQVTAGKVRAFVRNVFRMSHGVRDLISAGHSFALSWANEDDQEFANTNGPTMLGLLVRSDDGELCLCLLRDPKYSNFNGVFQPGASYEIEVELLRPDGSLLAMFVVALEWPDQGAAPFISIKPKVKRHVPWQISQP